jgi:hypothetical protein
LISFSSRHFLLVPHLRHPNLLLCRDCVHGRRSSVIVWRIPPSF